LEIVRLQEQMATLRQEMFGASSEKRKTKDEAAMPPPPRNGHGPRQQIELPVEEHAHDLPEADRVCPDCGAVLAEWEGQTEDSEEITVVERHFIVRKHRRKKYRCKHGCAPVTAPGPLKLVEGGRYSVEFAVYVAIAKYLYHLPLERQVRMYLANSLVVDSQTLWDQIEVLAKHLAPSYQALRNEVFASPLIHADETYWLMLSKGSGKKWYAWTVASPAAVYHQIFDSRSTAAARDVLGDYRGNVVADGYEPYQTVARAGPDGLARFILAFCWAHVRRKYVKAEPFAPTCAEAIDLIGKLYEIERDLPNPHTLTGPEQEAALAHILAVRHERSLPVVEEIKAWAGRQQGLPESTFRKAIKYMLDLWHGLTVFLENPWVPLDNNLVERQIRPLVVGRKNHYGSKSKRGTEVAALFYSLIETAQMRGEDPAAYLQRAALAAITTPGTVTLPTTRE
jgi:transposase